VVPLTNDRAIVIQKPQSIITNNKHRNRSRTRRRQQHSVSFIGIDGEGVTRPDGKHDYILLSIGDQSLYNPDGSRLHFIQIMEFLWSNFLKAPDANYVGFYLGYDFSQWLKDLPENRAKYLLDRFHIEKRSRKRSGKNRLPFPVEYQDWMFDIMPNMKRFRLWRKGSTQRMYVCDVGAFFQTSLLNAINPKNWPEPILSQEEYSIIEEGKAERGQDSIPYGTAIDSKMIEYNILENDILSRLMSNYNKGLVDIGIKLKRDQWFGPGQVAQTWMNNIQSPTREQFEQNTSLEIRQALRATYYGGWFEIFAHGHIGDAYSYDINSAYPHIQSNLPCCRHGVWKKNTHKILPNFIDISRNKSINNGCINSTYQIVFGSIKGGNKYIGVLPYRTKQGRILRPNEVKGWYWWNEIQAAITCGLIQSVNINESYEYVPCDCPPPFATERTLYLDRLRLGKNSAAGKARKLVYNSAYGKTAQSVGTAKYANMFYASYITMMCRVMILQAIATYPGDITDVLMVATDSITFRKPHTNLDLHSRDLGKWTQTKHKNLTLFMPGIYWDDSTRNKIKKGEHPTLKSRGIPAKAIIKKLKEIDRLFQNPNYRQSGLGWPTIEIPIHLTIISPKQALARGKWYLCGAILHNTVRKISADPSAKRAAAFIDNNGLVRTWCYQHGPTLESTPYERTFGDQELAELDEMYHPDGEITTLVADIFKE
jgi:DNA polymerase type B, organellar and viral